jgi:hypothetical protein
MRAVLRVAVETLHAVLLLPPPAVFSESGTDAVWVMNGRTPERRSIDVDRRNADHVVVRRGVSAGERVALRNPLQPEARP